MKRVVVLLFGAWSCGLAATPLNFDDAWQQVLQNNQGLAAERSGVTRAEQLAEAATALNLPQIDLQGNYTRLEKPVELDLMDLNPIASNKQSPLLNSPVVQQLIQQLGGASAFVTPFTEQDVVTSSVQALWPRWTARTSIPTRSSPSSF